MRFPGSPGCISIVVMATALLSHAALDTARIEQLTGAKGQMNEKEGVFKVSMPRADLKVTSGGVKITPALGLTCWASFKEMDGHTVVMGDQVVTENQANEVMSAALDNGLEVTALHNHFFGDTPKVMFMHIGGMGETDKLAAAVGRVFATIKKTAQEQTKHQMVEIDPAKSNLDPKKIEQIIGTKGQLASGVYKITIGRITKMSGHEMGNAMGVNTWAAFAGSDEQAVVDGDYAMTEKELQAVLKALRGHGIEIVAIHNHMVGEEPRIVFLHYWGIGPTEKLAAGLKAALDSQKVAAER